MRLQTVTTYLHEMTAFTTYEINSPGLPWLMVLVKAVFQTDGHWSFHVCDDAYQRVGKLVNISEKYMQCIKLPLLMSDLC